MTLYQRLVLKALSQILRILANHHPSLKAMNDADELRNEINHELNKEQS